MEWLDKLTGKNDPQYKKALELRRKQIQDEGARVSEQMQEDFKANAERDAVATKRITDAQDAEIADKLREMGIDPDQMKKDK